VVYLQTSGGHVRFSSFWIVLPPSTRHCKGPPFEDVIFADSWRSWNHSLKLGLTRCAGKVIKGNDQPSKHWFGSEGDKVQKKSPRKNVCKVPGALGGGLVKNEIFISSKKQQRV